MPAAERHLFALRTHSLLLAISCSQGGALYYSSGNLGAVLSNVLDCEFVGNSAYSGWGGAIFGTDSVGTVYVQRSTFSGNYAYSSYTNTGHGGALMVASNFNLNLYDCSFTNNTALPYLQLMPLTYRFANTCMIFLLTTFADSFCLIIRCAQWVGRSDLRADDGREHHQVPLHG